MEQIYHHTIFDVLKKIVQKEGLKFRASRYSNYGDEYDWIKDKTDCVIQEILSISSQDYKNNVMGYAPYLICFCKENLSKKMWYDYADKNEGIQLGLDKSLCIETSLPDKDPAAFIECIYMAEDEVKDKEMLKSAIDELYSHYRVRSKIQDDLQVCISFIKQKMYEFEREYRYMIPHYHELSISQNRKGDIISTEGEDFNDKEFNGYGIEIIGDKIYCYQAFPKEALKSITLGYKTTDEQLEDVRKHLKKCGYNLEQISIRKVEEDELK